MKLIFLWIFREKTTVYLNMQHISFINATKIGTPFFLGLV